MTLKAVKAAKSLRELAAACKSAARSIDKDINEIIKTAGIKLAFRLVYETPVDTSQALSNWQVSYEIPTSSKLRAYKEGEKGSTKEYSAAKAFNRAKQLIKKKPPRIDLIISNNLTYIHKLNMGGSNQQPTAYYVERIEADIAKELNRAIQDYVNGN